jgi:hypothetical protein
LGSGEFGRKKMPIKGFLGCFSTPFLMAITLFVSAHAVSQTIEDNSPPIENTLPVEPSDTDSPLSTEEVEASPGREKDARGRWVDTSHEYIGTKADDLAIYLDRFFGSPIEDLESADSTVRFVTRYEWDGDDGSDLKFRLRGKVDLPRINDKLSVVFNGEDDDSNQQEQGERDRDSDDNQVGLQLNAREGERSRFDLTLSISSDLNLKPGARYRYKADLADWGRVRYTARVDYSNKNRFRQRHNIDLDYLTGERSLLRWSNKLEHGQVSEGIEWGSAVSWRYSYSVDSAIALIVGAVGKTEPDVPGFVLDDPAFDGVKLDDSSLVTNYGVVIRLRNRLYKDWLYVEFEPGYTQRKRFHSDDRHGVFYGRVNFEVYFNRGRESQRKKTPKAAVEQGSVTDTDFIPEGD